MTVNASGSNYLNQIADTTGTAGQVTEKKEDVLGRDTFLTMLVAQLENQDPLNPMEGTDFSAQLAQFSQLEQLMNINKAMGELKTAFEKGSDQDLFGYVGKKVTVKQNTMDVSAGAVSGGSYMLEEAADVMITITNENGHVVRTLYNGQETAGAHDIQWDGRDMGGNNVADGTYEYKIMANSGSGFEEIPSTVTGTVDAVIYDNDVPYLIVDGMSVDAGSILAVFGDSQDPADQLTAADYLGKNVTAHAPAVLVENNAVSGGDLEFDLQAPEDAVVQVYNQDDQLVRSLVVLSDDVQSGTNQVAWDGMDNDGNQAEDGLYYYVVETADNAFQASTSDQVTAIRYYNGLQYLVMENSGRLVLPDSVTSIN